MARRIRWTPGALRDLEATADYIAQDSPRYAAAIVREVRTAAASLTKFALRGRPVPEFSTAGVRELLIRNYRLIYQVYAEEVAIIAFIHGARDLWLFWEREGRPRPENSD